MHDDLNREQRLASMGWTGTGLRLAAAVIDPVAIGIGLASDGLAAPMVAGLKVSRIGRALAAASTAAAGNLAAEVIPGEFKPTHTALDYVYAAAGGAAWGATFGALGRNPAVKEEAQAIVKAGSTMASEAEREFGKAVGIERVQSSDAGAMEASFKESLRADNYDVVRTDFDTSVAAPKTAFGRVRFDAMGSLKSSPNPLTRAIGGIMAEDAVGNADRAIPTAIGATEWQGRIHRSFETQWAQVRESGFKEWMKETGVKFTERWGAKAQYLEEVTRYVRSRGNPEDFSPAARRLGDQYRKLTAQVLELANDPGALDGTIRRPVKGFGSITADQHYVTRVFDHRKAREVAEKFGDKSVRALISGALRSANPTVSKELADKYARSYWKTVRKVGAGMEVGVSHAFGGDNLDTLKELLTEAGDMSAKDIDDLISYMGTRDKEDGAHTRAKHRMVLDENYAVQTVDGKLAFTDLLNNDIDHLFSLYSRQMTGAAALARLRITNPLDEASPPILDGVTSRGEWDTAMQRIRSVADELNIDRKRTETDLKNLDHLYRSIAGIPPHGADTPAATALRMIGDYNFIRIMNQVGFAQVSEIGAVLGRLGWRASVSSMPGLRALWRNAKSGRIDDALSDELEGIFGIGADWLRSGIADKWDEFGAPGSLFDGSPGLKALDNALQTGKRVTSLVSGMSTVNTFLHRWSLRAVASKFTNELAQEGLENTDRLRALGISDKMLPRIQKEFNVRVTTEPGLWSPKVKRLNLDQWSDLEAREALVGAMNRLARQVVQENDPGMMHRFMSNPVARIFLQFRSFTMGAWSKQLLHNIHMRDGETFALFTMTSAWAGIAYMMQTYAQSVGRSDREAFLEERLSPAAIGKASFQRAGYASLIPTVVDTAAAMGGLDPMFDYRSSGQVSNVLFGSPTVGLLDNARSVTGPLQSSVFEGRALSQREIRQINSVLPFSNFLPWSALLNTMISNQPEKHR